MDKKHRINRTWEYVGMREAIINKLNVIHEVRHQFNGIDSISQIEEMLWSNLEEMQWSNLHEVANRTIENIK